MVFAWLSDRKIIGSDNSWRRHPRLSSFELPRLWPKVFSRRKETRRESRCHCIISALNFRLGEPELSWLGEPPGTPGHWQKNHENGNKTITTKHERYNKNFLRKAYEKIINHRATEYTVFHSKITRHKNKKNKKFVFP